MVSCLTASSDLRISTLLEEEEPVSDLDLDLGMVP